MAGPSVTPRPRVAAISVGETTAAAVVAARAMIEAAGYAVRLFDATPEGGRHLEQAVRDGRVGGVLDLTPADLAGPFGRDRLTAAGLAGVPQVVSPGGLDAVDGRRSTAAECDRLGQDIAQKACAARGPTAILIPLRGLSTLDVEGGPHWHPESNEALVQSLRNWVYGVELVELDRHINDPGFALVCAETLLRLLNVTNPSQSPLDS